MYALTGWRDATQVAFYGTGIDSPQDGRTNFRMKQGYATGGLRARPLPWAVFNGALSYEDFTTAGGSGAAPSIDEVPTPQSAPGLGANPAYLHTTASAAIDWRPSPGYARRGGLYEVRYHNYADRDEIEMSAVGGPNASWQKPVHAYFKRLDAGWRLVGFERLPEEHGESSKFKSPEVQRK